MSSSPKRAFTPRHATGIVAAALSHTRVCVVHSLGVVAESQRVAGRLDTIVAMGAAERANDDES